MKTMTNRKTGSCLFSDSIFRKVATVLLLTHSFFLNAQTFPMAGVLPSENEVVEGISVGAGRSSVTDEYLSPNLYSGFSIEARQDRMGSRGDDRLFRYSRNRSSLSASHLRNDTGNGVQLEAAAVLVHVRETQLLHYKYYDLLFGPSAMGGLDAIYNLRNSNNPANVHGWIAAGVGADSMFRFRMCKRQLALDASVSMPVIGVFFAPEYNLPYYLLYEEGLYGKALHFMHPFNVSVFSHDVALFVPMGRNQLSLSMSFDIMAHRLGGNYAGITHSRFSLGYVHRFERKYNGR
ncbi:MAG: DUF3316 domain-containing protein [Bacteroidaceae bacterium]|nr:DUF3316 domain-containing protein [Bacteroidaceae bacterium]